ncbi:MAG: HAMP domain-containing sensor histidine kinase, partial [Bacilli bacterium]|nr:HAMP domain-containing sensor histidine kinase [Bacilli bacterium]
PLNSIVGLSQLIRDGDNIEDMKSDSIDIIKASEDLLEIINGILDINVLDANRLELLEEAYDPHELFKEIESIAKVRIGEKPINYTTNYFNDIPNKLYGDKEKIKRIITNIISNSVKFTDNGTIMLNISSTVQNGYCVLRLSLSDTGRGIKNEDIPHVFEKFYRASEYRDSDIQGTGLGLAITKGLVELFNGRISVDSMYGSGSTFTVLLPQKIVNN